MGDSSWEGSNKAIHISLAPASNACLTEAQLELSLPDWFFGVAGEVVDLIALPADWDSYGAPPIKSSTAMAALKALAKVIAPGVPRPSVFPESAGGVVFEFEAGSGEMTLTVHRPGHVSFYSTTAKTLLVDEKKKEMDSQVISAA